MNDHIALVYKNLIRTGLVSGSTELSGYPVANVLTKDKTETFRATGKSVNLSGGGPMLKTADTFYLMGNFSPTMTVRIRLWAEPTKITLLYDSGVILACPAPAAEIAGWEATPAASAYAHGGGAQSTTFLTAPIGFRGWEIALDDTTGNLQSQLEVAFLVVGLAWQPTYDIEGGFALSIHDTSVKMRSAAGSVRSRRGPKYRSLPLPLTNLTNADRAHLLKVFRYVGSTSPVLAVLHPGNADYELVRDTTVYGTLDETSEMLLQGPDQFATTLTLDEL